jgi:hypothetical protein
LSIEKQFSIETSFAWRLLYFFFLRRSSGMALEVFLHKKVPTNAHELTLRCALETVLLACRECKLVTEQQTLCLFVGVDEYQKIAQDIRPSGAVELLDCFSTVHADPIDGLALLPMLTGTELGVVGNVGSSHNANIARIPMRLLAVHECEESIEAVLPVLLEHEAARRHLFQLSGVARWSVEYAKTAGARPLTSDNLERAQTEVRSAYVPWFSELLGKEGSQSGMSGLALVKVVAWAFSGLSVAASDGVEGISWSRLRDKGVCLVDDTCRVSVPYVQVTRVAALGVGNWIGNPAVRCFIEALAGLRHDVDEQFYRHEPWHLWELFGAYFHAARINALQVLGHTTVKFRDICGGALVKGCVEMVRLRPVKVFRAAFQFGRDTGNTIAQFGHPQQQGHWITGEADGVGSVVVNGTNGQGVDIFFCLQKESCSAEYVVCVDQRKRVPKSLDTKVASDLIEHARASLPAVLVNPTMVVGLCSMYPSFGGDTESLPDNSFVVSRNCSGAYHGGLAGHPASRPIVAVNTDTKASIQMFLCKDAPKVAQAICARRAAGRFASFEELRLFVDAQGGSFRPDAQNFLFF